MLPAQVESAAPGSSLAPVSEEAPGSRPRGDSIIFDPSSFQEGGIHEQHALERASGTLPTLPPQAVHSMTAPPSVHTNTVQAPPRARPRPQSAPRGRPPTSSAGRPHHGMSNAVFPNNTQDPQVATLPSLLVMEGNGSNSQSPATFQMDLLNKDGRIGIYLPEARRARIARFHAKRKMRIWRKRIKYDCRKKLADSRPRIKGRFVKRSDMDDELPPPPPPAPMM